MPSACNGLTLRASGLALMLASFACTPRSGQIVVRHPDGQVRWSVETVDGVPHGQSETFDPDGQLTSRGQFSEGRRHGVTEHLDPDGRVTRRELWLHGEMVWSGDGPVPPGLEPPAPVRPPGRTAVATPDFVFADRVGPTDHGFVQYGHHDELGRPEPSTASRLQLFAQRTFGPAIVYLDTIASSSDYPATRGEAGKMTLEAGTALSRSLVPSREGISLGGLVRIGGYVPLDGDDRAGFAVCGGTSIVQVTDTVLCVPRTAGVRASLSLFGQNGWAFYRADVGLDTALALRPGEDIAARRPATYLSRATLAGGALTDWIVLTGEVSAVVPLNEPDSSAKSALAGVVSVRLRRWAIRPFAGLAIPLYEAIRYKPYSVLAGIEYAEGAR